MSEVKRCQQCGILKEEEAFRQYTYSKNKGTPGRYRICRQCESINSAYKKAKDYLSDPDLRAQLISGPAPMYVQATETVEKTERLYATLVSRGLRIPTAKPQVESQELSAVDKLLEFYEVDTPKATVQINSSDIPSDLREWLETPWEKWTESGLSPEYLQETVYESLKAKYRPQIGIDKERMIPIYDDTYKVALNDILRRFDEYEDYRSTQEEEEQ